MASSSTQSIYFLTFDALLLKFDLKFIVANQPMGAVPQILNPKSTHAKIKKQESAELTEHKGASAKVYILD